VALQTELAVTHRVLHEHLSRHPKCVPL
jgi:hypothetical protein